MKHSPQMQVAVVDCVGAPLKRLAGRTAPWYKVGCSKCWRIGLFGIQGT